MQEPAEIGSRGQHSFALWLSHGGATVLLMSLASAFDLPLSRSIANQNSTFGLVFEQVGQLPGCACAAVGALVFLSSVLLELLPGQQQEGCCHACPSATRAACQTSAGVLFSLLVHIVGFGSIIHDITNASYQVAGGVAFLVVCVVLSLVALVPTTAQGRSLKSSLCRWRMLAVCLVLQFGVAGGAVTVIKVLWGRARPYMVLGSTETSWAPNPICQQYTVFNGTANMPQPGPYSCRFTPWWLPQVSRFTMPAKCMHTH